MNNHLKTLQVATSCFVGYGGTRFPHVDQPSFAFLRCLSRGGNACSLLKVIARHVDRFLYLYLCGVTPARVVALARRVQGLPP
jgi:hypothetical protein